MTLGQETRWAYSTTLLSPHGADYTTLLSPHGADYTKYTRSIKQKPYSLCYTMEIGMSKPPVV